MHTAAWYTVEIRDIPNDLLITSASCFVIGIVLTLIRTIFPFFHLERIES